MYRYNGKSLTFMEVGMLVLNFGSGILDDIIEFEGNGNESK